MERQTKRPSGTVVDARMSLAHWLRAGRAQRGMSIEDVAKVTKIQPRILDRLEAGKLDGLPAEVFVRGFIRSFARCVGLDEREALDRHTMAIAAQSKDVVVVGPSARALVDSMSDLAPRAARASNAANVKGPVLLAQAPLELASVDIEVGIAAEPMLETIPASSMDVRVADVVAEATAPVAVVEGVASLAAAALIEVVEPAISVPSIVEAAVVDPAVKPKRKRKAAAAPRSKRKSLATGTPFEASPVVAAAGDDTAVVAAPAPIAASIESITVVEVPVTEVVAAAVDAARPIICDDERPGFARSVFAEAAPISAIAAALEGAIDKTVSSIHTAGDVEVVLDDVPARDSAGAILVVDAEAAAPEYWAPKMPPLANTPSVPWRRPSLASAVAVAPSLVIDDSDPDGAERVLEDRANAKISTTNAQRRSFLPPILLDREDRSARQGGLTLAVILLLIAATITLSYLMRRPSSSGDGITQREAPALTSPSVG